MAQQLIGLGSTANDGTGDSLRVAGDKINDNFTELYQGTFRVLASSNVAVTCPADTNENILATVTIPAGAMGPNGEVRIWSLFSAVSSGNNKTVRVRLGGLAGTIYLQQTMTTQVTLQDLRRIMNRNSQSSQISGIGVAAPLSSSTNAKVTSSINTGAATDIVLIGQLANAGDTLVLESYLIELFYKA